MMKEVQFTRKEYCNSCKGSREKPGSRSLECYSCKGKGTKEDALFKKTVRCNTCKGHGTLV